MPQHDQRQHRGWLTLALSLTAVIALAFAHASPQPEPTPERGIKIRLVNGQILQGVLVESSETQLQIRVGRILSTIDRADIDRIEMLPTFAEEYQDLKSAAQGSGIENWLALAVWLENEKQLQMALDELDTILKKYPGNTRAAKMHDRLTAQMVLNSASNEPAVRQTPKPDDANLEFRLLSESDINIIKVYELDVNNPPKIEISRATIEKLMTQFAGHPLIPATHEQRGAMLRMPADQILKIMFQLRARDLYSEVKVLGHPESIRRFKNDVHRPWIQTRCVTCHNITSDSKLRLYDQRRNANSDEAVYTNFLILDRFVTSDGQSLLDIDKPERSPLLQIALDRRNSVFPHPEVIDPETGRDLFVPAFRTTKERRFKQAVQWVDSLYKPRVDYPVELPEPPRATPAPESAGSGEGVSEKASKSSGGGER